MLDACDHQVQDGEECHSAEPVCGQITQIHIPNCQLFK